MYAISNNYEIRSQKTAFRKKSKLVTLELVTSHFSHNSYIYFY
ncbi:unnamed protein product [Musa acuminata subsp. malaccensis]|uniref:Uncharacterized protein n=1 Tax=Musa acuminata subsp. malaccensis TaxID=214687 RepID=A0A804HNG0_MUSAM|nr:unnamed protein product [Musa acuminata subsp. malaccensis]